jgi:thioredoxin
MAVVELTMENINQEIQNSEIMLIDFWAPWCAPCRRFAPVFEASSEQNTDVRYAKLNTEDQPEIASEFGIQSIPTIAVFKKQVLIFMQPGMIPDDALNDLVEKVREFDVEAAIAAEEAEKNKGN